MSVEFVLHAGECFCCGQKFELSSSPMHNRGNQPVTLNETELAAYACKHNSGYVISEGKSTQVIVCKDCFRTMTMDELIALDPSLDDDARYRMACFKEIYEKE